MKALIVLLVGIGILCATSGCESTRDRSTGPYGGSYGMPGESPDHDRSHGEFRGYPNYGDITSSPP
ncbi:MAG TPA: hypothetical protein VEC99_15165 [Clostridia bacterium]|nr:hypothetical protein [Clostridia bacterium]